MDLPHVTSALDEALARFEGAKLAFVDGVWVNESVRGRDLKYYIFDWDDNVLCMPTRIHMERLNSKGQWVPHVCSTATYSVIRADTEHYRFPQGRRELAFVEFQDTRTPLGGGTFLDDLDRALDAIAAGRRTPPPSFATFRKTLVEGRLFAIVTARGHASETLCQGVERFIERVLSPVEREIMLINLRGYSYCFDHVQTFPSQTAPSSIGFSDDDPRNVKAVQEYIERVLSRRFPTVKFCVYDTSDGAGAHKMMISGQLELPLE